MDIIKPTPSQSAVVLKKYLESQGLSIALNQAQEAMARMNGFASFQALASAVPLREKDIPSGDLEKWNGYELYCVCGRFHGDDDDSPEHIWTKEGVLDAVDQFKEEILDFRGYNDSTDDDTTDEEADAEEDENSPLNQIYVTSTRYIGKVEKGQFVFESEVLPR